MLTRSALKNPYAVFAICMIALVLGVLEIAIIQWNRELLEIEKRDFRTRGARCFYGNGQQLLIQRITTRTA